MNFGIYSATVVLHFAAFLTLCQGENSVGEEKRSFKMVRFDDAILRQMYLEYAIPCDRLVSNPALIQNFTQDYVNRTGQIVEPALLAHHMLNLRRLG